MIGGLMSKFLTPRNKAASRAARVAELEHRVADGGLAGGQMTVAESNEVLGRLSGRDSSRCDVRIRDATTGATPAPPWAPPRGTTGREQQGDRRSLNRISFRFGAMSSVRGAPGRLATLRATSTARTTTPLTGRDSGVSESALRRFLVLEDNFGGYHWELVAGNGEILVRSGNFASYDYADRAAGIALVATNRLVSHAPGHDCLANMAPAGWRDDGRSLSDAVKKWSVEA
jgi:uncharacterized protein YegP (UPF0339 family)